MNRTRFSLVVFTVTLLVVGFAASAGAVPSVGTLELNSGYAKSATELGTTTESMGGGITFGAAYWRGISPTVSWGAEMSFDNLGNADATSYDPIFGVTYSEKFSTKVFRINPALRVSFGAPVGPSFFAQGGVGLYNVSWKYNYSDDTGFVVVADDSESKLGLNFGAGVGFPVGPKTKMNFTGSYHLVGGNDVNMNDANYIQIRAGLGFGL